LAQPWQSSGKSIPDRHIATGAWRVEPSAGRDGGKVDEDKWHGDEKRIKMASFGHLSDHPRGRR
jgi:hypothetical protein